MEHKRPFLIKINLLGTLRPEVAHTGASENIIERFCVPFVRLWHWSAKWRWYDTLLLLAIAVMPSLGEYAFSALFLFLSAFSLISNVSHKGWPSWRKQLSTIVVALILSVTMFIIVSNKGQQPWSHLQSPLESFLAMFTLSAEAKAIPAFPANLGPPRGPTIENVPIPSLNAPSKMPSRTPRPPVESVMGQVQLGVGMGDDNATNTLTLHDTRNPGDLSRAFLCGVPFTCYSEANLASQYVVLNVGEKKWGHVFFMVENTGTVLILHPSVDIASQTKGVSVYRPGQRSTTPQQAFEIGPTETVELIPYSTSDSNYDYVTDVTVDDSISEFELGFRIFADNLKVRDLLVLIHAGR